MGNLFYTFWLTSVCMTSLGPFTSLQMTQFHPFFMAEQNTIIYKYHIFFIHSSVDGQLGHFRVLDIVNCAAMNIRVHVSFWNVVFSGYMSSCRIAASLLLLLSQSCWTLCNPMDCTMPGSSVLHCIPTFAQTQVHWVYDAGAYGNSIFNFLRSPHAVLLCGWIKLHSHQESKRIPFSPHSL